MCRSERGEVPGTEARAGGIEREGVRREEESGRMGEESVLISGCARHWVLREAGEPASKGGYWASWSVGQRAGPVK
jgi:hypothetical protein